MVGFFSRLKSEVGDIIDASKNEIFSRRKSVIKLLTYIDFLLTIIIYTLTR